MKVETKTYKSDRAYRKDLEKRLKQGWQASPPQITQTRGGLLRWMMPILLIVGPKKNRFHVTYTKEV